MTRQGAKETRFPQAPASPRRRVSSPKACDRRCEDHERNHLRLQTLVASVQAGVLEEDGEGRVVLVNEAFCRMFGVEATPEDLAGRSTREAFGATQHLFADGDAFLARIEELARHRERVLSEDLPLSDGRSFERDYLPGDPEDTPSGGFWIFRDVTVHKQTAAELRSTAERYRDFVENGVASAWSHDLDGVLRSGNRALAAVLGAESPEELVGRRIQDAVDPRYRDLWDTYIRELLETGESRGIGSFRGLDGRRRVVAYSNVLRHAEDGQPVVRGFGEDVTEQTRAQQALRRRSELESHLVAISTRLINLSTASIDEAVGHALAELTRSLRADRGVIYLLSACGELIELAHEWRSPAAESEAVTPVQLRVRELPALMKTLHRLEPYRVERPAELPPSSFLEQGVLEALGVTSFLVVPISTRGELMGFVGLAMHNSESLWPQEVVSVARVIGDIVGGALDRKRGEEELAAANRALATANRVLEENQLKAGLLNEMGDLLLTAQDPGEAKEVASAFLPRIFAGFSGAAYLQPGAEGQALEPVVRWGAAAPGAEPVRVDECWALRRSRPHEVERPGGGPVCAHVGHTRDHQSLCLPLMANGELLGLLHLRHPRIRAADSVGDLASEKHLAHSTAEQLALSLANLQLRESLRSQALHDPLTGLHNRRYLEERLERELQRAARAGTPLAVLMLDLDHFKRVNDVHGHAEGDRVLARVARLLVDGVRAEDVVARYGGEEFTVVLTGTSEEDARWVAEKLRKGVRRLAVEGGDRAAESLSLSIGVAVSPACGTAAADMLAAADGALYEAKRSGRDRVVVAAPTLPEVMGAGA